MDLKFGLNSVFRPLSTCCDAPIIHDTFCKSCMEQDMGDMTTKAYKQRIEALGFKNGNQWARFVGISRSAHTRQCMEPHQKNSRDIPQTLWRIVEWLEQGKLVNPNDQI